MRGNWKVCCVLADRLLVTPHWIALGGDRKWRKASLVLLLRKALSRLYPQITSQPI